MGDGAWSAEDSPSPKVLALVLALQLVVLARLVAYWQQVQSGLAAWLVLAGLVAALVTALILSLRISEARRRARGK
jgi:hypothetical protein